MCWTKSGKIADIFGHLWTFADTRWEMFFFLKLSLYFRSTFRLSANLK